MRNQKLKVKKLAKAKARIKKYVHLKRTGQPLPPSKKFTMSKTEKSKLKKSLFNLIADQTAN